MAKRKRKKKTHDTGGITVCYIFPSCISGVGEAPRQLMKRRQREHVSDTCALRREKKKGVMKFCLVLPLLLCLPKMNWLFRFKKVHDWNTKRGSSISPLNSGRKILRLCGGGTGGSGEVCCWSLIRPRQVLQRKHQSSLLCLETLWTAWDNFFTVSLL